MKVIKFLTIALASFNIFWCGAGILMVVMAGRLNFETFVFQCLAFGLLLLCGMTPIALMRRRKEKLSFVLALCGMLIFFGYVTYVGGDEERDNFAHIQTPKP